MSSPQPNIDAASELVAELQAKLAALDRKVAAYRLTLTHEFTKYSEQLLADVPQDTAVTVCRRIAESLKNYPALVDPTADAIKKSIESCAAPGSTITSPPIFTPPSNLQRDARDGTEIGECLRSLHEREKEFHGVFTPLFLPCLEDQSRHERRSSRAPQIPPNPDSDKGKVVAMEGFRDEDAVAVRSLSHSPDGPRSHTPRRRNTDEASVASDHSEGAARRSALRRLSSSSKGLSPRRVRFEVAGREVLPTVSPLPAGSILQEMTPGSFSALDDSSPQSDDTSDGIVAELVEESKLEPPPKRVSSSQRLRELSRAPLEGDDTMWTTVSAPPDGSASVAVSAPANLEDGDGLSPGTEDLEHEQRTSANIERAGGIIPQSTSNGFEDEVETYSDEGEDQVLDMKPSRATTFVASITPSHLANRQPQPLSPRTEQVPPSIVNHPAGLPKSEKEDGFEDEGEDEDEDGDDELFAFDEDNDASASSKPLPPVTPTPRPARSPSPPLWHRLTPSKSRVADTENAPLSQTAYSSSPARPINPSKASTGYSNTTPITQRGVIGSFKGHPFSMPIVDEAIHSQAVGWGQVRSFVGSLDGRTGMDESATGSFGRGASGRDLGSWKGRGEGRARGSAIFDGHPRSLSERMLLEEERELEEEAERQVWLAGERNGG